MVRMPPRTSVLARSVAPVKSSAMQPRRSFPTSPIRTQPGDGVGPKLQGRDASHRLSALFEEAWVGGGLPKSRLVRDRDPRRPFKSLGLELALFVCEIGEPKSRASRGAMGQGCNSLALGANRD